jgi:hypothetical protein
MRNSAIARQLYKDVGENDGNATGLLRHSEADWLA